jgi:hypothetical protein
LAATSDPVTSPLATTGLSDLSTGQTVPSPIGRKILAFEFVVLLEYWIAPIFLGITNYAGIWSEAGTLLMILFVSSLIVLVVLPLRPHLRAALTTTRNRAIFHGIWWASFVVALFVTNTIQFVDGPSTGPVSLGQTTVYTPFGAWASLTVYDPTLHLWATFNPEGPTILILLSFLSAASVVLGPWGRPRTCPAPSAPPRAWSGRLASAGIVAPLGFITGCTGCSPLYFSALALVAPGTAEGASAAIPLVPWIGFAGLLYLFGFWLATRLIRHATTLEDPNLAAASTG